MDNKRNLLINRNIRQNGMIIALICIILFFEVITKGIMFHPMNLSNLIMQNSYVIFLAIGMFFCILTGNVDLSVGSVVAVSGALMGFMTVQHGIPTTVAVVLTLILGTAIGIFQGFFIAFIKVPPFIVTLAGMMIFRGITYVILAGQTLAPFSSGFQYFASGFFMTDVKIYGCNAVCLILIIISAIILVFSERNKRKNRIKYGFEVPKIGFTIFKLFVLICVIAAILMRLSEYKGLPFIMLILIVVIVFYSFVANKTRIGRHIYAVGGNMQAAKLSGVKTKWIMFLVYVNCSVMATIAGLVVTGRLNAATAKAGNSYELDAIAACYIGGCSASGGSGKVLGAIVGAAVMGILNNGMSILGIGSDMQQVIKGFILLITVSFDIYSKSKVSK